MFTLQTVMGILAVMILLMAVRFMCPVRANSDRSTLFLGSVPVR